MIEKTATKYCSNQIVCPKYCRKCYVFNIFFLVNILHWFCSTSEALKTPRLNAYYLWWLQLPSKFCSKTIVKRHLSEFLPFCESFNFFDNFFTLNLVLHKANIRLFQFDFHSEFKSLDHLLVEILILIMVITNFILY